MIRFAENLNKMITAGLGGALEAPRTEVAVGHCIRYLEASGPVASFESNIAAPIRNLRVDMRPIQAGSGDPSPDNIRPITGRDSVTVVCTGVNLLPPVLKNNAESLTNNGVTLTIVNGKFHLSGTGTSNGGRNVLRSAGFTLPAGIYTRVGSMIVMKADSTIISYTTFRLTEATEIYIGFNTVTGTVYDEDREIAIVNGGTAVAWSPYNGQSATIQLGQTVYGGTVDFTTGVLTVEWENIASYDGEALPGEWISDRDAYAPGTTPTTGAQVCYKLATPITIDLTPAQLTTVLGVNNVWSDAGDVTLEYPYYEETEGY